MCAECHFLSPGLRRSPTLTQRCRLLCFLVWGPARVAPLPASLSLWAEVGSLRSQAWAPRAGGSRRVCPRVLRVALGSYTRLSHSTAFLPQTQQENLCFDFLRAILIKYLKLLLLLLCSLSVGVTAVPFKVFPYSQRKTPVTLYEGSAFGFL